MDHRFSLHRNVQQVLPLILSLTPIGFLFGIVAARHDWSLAGAALLSILGFSGSGQFVLFSLKDQNVGWLLSFGIILLINMRYIPMSIAAARPVKGSFLTRLMAAHCLCDEVFAIERPETSKWDRIACRLLIALCWTLGTIAGVVCVDLIPESVAEKLGRISFPASALLTLLALLRARDFTTLFPVRGKLGLLAAILASAVLYFVLGPRLFWLPGIAASFLLLSLSAKNVP